MPPLPLRHHACINQRINRGVNGSPAARSEWEGAVSAAKTHKSTKTASYGRSRLSKNAMGAEMPPASVQTVLGAALTAVIAAKLAGSGAILRGALLDAPKDCEGSAASARTHGDGCLVSLRLVSRCTQCALPRPRRLPRRLPIGRDC